jgi:acetoin utilization deacetylase AcuC-like enzyme
MGFCLFNNVAIAAELAISELGAERVFILDWDLHHGNGTAEAFRYRSDVLFASIHESGSFPGTGQADDAGSGEGQGYTINLPVPPGSDGELWLSLLEHVVIPAADQFDPDLTLISAGYDAHEADPLATCRLQTETFAEMARQTRDLTDFARAPLGAVLEGGYQPQVLAECVAETMRGLDGSEPASSSAPDALLTSRAAARVGHFWEP